MKYDAREVLWRADRIRRRLDVAGVNAPPVVLTFLELRTAPRATWVLQTKTGLGAHGLSRALAKLEALDLVVKSYDPEDGRVNLYSLSSKGVALVMELEDGT